MPSVLGAAFGELAAEHGALERTARRGAPVQAVIGHTGEVRTGGPGRDLEHAGPAIFPTTLRATLSEIGPMITCGFPASSVSTEVRAVSLLASPESWESSSIVIPTPASSMSCTASWAPASVGGPKAARAPVAGSSVPIFSAIGSWSIATVVGWTSGVVQARQRQCSSQAGSQDGDRAVQGNSSGGQEAGCEAQPATTPRANVYLFSPL